VVRGVNADELEASGTDVLESMSGTRSGHDDVAGADLDFVAASDESSSTGSDDPSLRVGVTVELGARSRLVVG
jgi:hypothetical protein